MSIISTLRAAYGAGYRAGMSGGHYLLNPFNPRRQLIRCILWDNGWHTGMMKQLNAWLASRRGAL